MGDRIWLYTPVVNQGHTRKFASFWKGPYTVNDKPSEVTYKIQLFGGSYSNVSGSQEQAEALLNSTITLN